MKKHFITLFDATHLKRTIYLFIIAALLITISLFGGIGEYLSGIALISGIILLFFTVLHPWKKAGNYGMLAMVCICILILLLLGITILDKMNKGEYINDNIAEGLVFFICVPGILVSIIGGIICAIRKK
jgi:hypothetical protein